MSPAVKESQSDRSRILVVYDEPATRTLVVRALNRSHEVVETQETKTALDLLASASRSHFDVAIVTCLARPGRPDYPLCVGLVLTMFHRWPWIPVIVIARAQECARLTAAVLVSGARQFLLKPFTPSQLVAAVKRATTGRGRRGPIAPAAVATMRRVLAFLGDHLAEDPTLTELSSLAAMSRSHFSHTFHKAIGMPLRHYVQDLRLRRAHQLLLTSPLSITAIAIEAGFYDLPHFDKVFRHRIGLSPQTYRSRHARR